MPEPKATTLRRHTKKRAEERYGLKLSRVDIAKIVSRLGKDPTLGRFIEKQSNDRAIWLINYEGVEMKVVFSKRHKTLVTVLPMVDSSEYVSKNADKTHYYKKQRSWLARSNETALLST